MTMMTAFLTQVIVVMVMMVIAIVVAMPSPHPKTMGGWLRRVLDVLSALGELIGGLLWFVRPRALVELLLPPHMVCPSFFKHLSLKQWRDNAGRGCEDDQDIFEWLEARNLPPVPRDKYCPEKGMWVDDMERDEREAYLKELRHEGLRT
jgi:hypothetical protein